MANKKYPKNIADKKSKEDDDKIVTCFICSVEEKWKDHKRRKKHTSKLLYFTKKFVDNSSDHVRCKSCKNQIPKDSFVQHARRHKLIPWYRPKDEFVTYFKNFIKPTCEKYYCRLCVQECETWYSSLSHIDCKKHKRRLKNYIGKEDIDEADLSSDVCESWVINDIFPFRFTQLQCWACNLIIDGYETSGDHIAGKVHEDNLTRKKIKRVTEKLMKSFLVDAEVTSSNFDNNLDINVNSITINDDSSVNDNDNNIEPQLTSCSHPVTNTVLKEIFYFIGSSIYNFYSSLRNMISNETIDPTPHEKVVNIYQVENDSILDDLRSSSESTDLLLYELFKNFIFRSPKNDYYCFFCHIILPFKFLHSNAKEHMEDSNHQNLVKKNKHIKNIADELACTPISVDFLGRNNILQVDNSFLHCFTCFRLIPSYSCALEHLDDVQHKIKWNNLLDEIFKPFVVSEIDESSVNEPDNKSIADNEIIPLIETSSQTEILQSPPASIENKEASSSALPVVFYRYNDGKKTIKYCYICRKRLNSVFQYHIHLSGHYWQFFSDTSEDLETFVNLKTKVPISISGGDVEQVSLGIVDGGVLFKCHPRSERRKILGQQAKVGYDDWRDKGINGNKKITLKDLDIEDDNNVSDKFDIYEMNEEIRHMIQLSLSRICIINEDEIYCMICRKNVKYSLQIVYEHFRSIEHSYFLMQMVQDQMKFEGFPDEFSDFNLARELIEDKSERHVVCFVCEPIAPTIIANRTGALEIHISSQSHRDRRSELSRNLQRFIKSLHTKLVCNWFNVQRYWCVICSRLFKHENKFYKHLKSKNHQTKCEKFVRFENLVYDFCPTCGVLFYGFKNTFVYHSNCQLHKFYIDRNFFFISRLPEAGAELVTNAEENLMNKLAMLEENNAVMKKEEQLLLKDLKIAITNFREAKIHPFGSRITGLGSMNSDLDIFLDCYDSYYKGNKLDDVLKILTKVENLLKQEKETWTIKRTVTNCRVPIIKLIHNITGIDCDLSFTNGLTTENSKLVKAYIDKYPLCKKLILFMKDWINACNLSGKDGISSYAIAWMVIYYLQTKFIVPSVAELIKIEGKSCVIGGWETGASKDFTLPDISIYYSFKDLLKGFFIMFAGFDYRNNILCPLLGCPIKKIDFVVPRKLSNLPEEMVSYKKYIKNKNAECFRSDSVMGVQDPFDLSHNLTKSVKKAIMYRFKTYCSMSAQLLDFNKELHVHIFK